MLPPERPLPFDPRWSSAEEYIQSLLNLVTCSDLLRNLCGGVHILDFLTRKPDLYSWVLPQDWRDWFDLVEIDDLLDLLFREDLAQFYQTSEDQDEASDSAKRSWRTFPFPPASFLQYIDTIRLHSLDRTFTSVSDNVQSLPRSVGVGMKPKKAHEVANFAAFVDQLSSYVSEQTQEVSCVIDFGSGQNYFGRTLALPPYNRHVIAIERHHHNVEGAKGMDVSVKLAKKAKILRNKKEFKKKMKQALLENGRPAPLSEIDVPSLSSDPGLSVERDLEQDQKENSNVEMEAQIYAAAVAADTNEEEQVAEVKLAPEESIKPPQDMSKGSMTYIEHELVDGHLEHILYPSKPGSDRHVAPSSSSSSNLTTTARPKAMAVSIHSCGNLTHHGLRSLVLNPSVNAVAMIGCCYNLLTERLGPATYKLPQLRPNHPRLEATANSYDPHGFPMSKLFEDYKYEINMSGERSIYEDPAVSGSKCRFVGRPAATTREAEVENSNVKPAKPTASSSSTESESQLQPQPQDRVQKAKGVRLNITARMMAVQAAANWTPVESSSFFTRHFYRALLQKLLLDIGVVKQADSPDDIAIAGGSLTGADKKGTPLIVGSLNKTAFTSFTAYVRAAMQKLVNSGSIPPDWDRSNINIQAPQDHGTNSSTNMDFSSSSPLTRQEIQLLKTLLLPSRNSSSSTSTIVNSVDSSSPSATRKEKEKKEEEKEREKEREKEEKELSTLLEKYPDQHHKSHHHLSTIWSLMAFSACVIESAILTDRYLWLTEQPEVHECWVQTVFEYGLSPRNLCVVGVKQGGKEG